MATAEEIQHRIEQADTARSTRRAAAAQQVGELAQRRAVLAEQLDEIDTQLGAVLAGASDVMGIDEFAKFTDIPASELSGWLTARKSARHKRKKPTSNVPNGVARQLATKCTPSADEASKAAVPTAESLSTQGHIAAGVT